MIKSLSRLPAPNVILSRTTTLAVPNVIIMIDFILVTAPNAFPDSLLINPLCPHAVFERSTDWERLNPSGTSDDRGDPLEQSCLGVGNSKTRKTLCQQLTIIYCSMFRLHIVARERERESVRFYEQTQRDIPPAWLSSLNSNFQLPLLTTDNFFKIHQFLYI